MHLHIRLGLFLGYCQATTQFFGVYTKIMIKQVSFALLLLFLYLSRNDRYAATSWQPHGYSLLRMTTPAEKGLRRTHVPRKIKRRRKLCLVSVLLLKGSVHE